MKMIKKQAVENYRIGKIVIEFCLLFRYEQYMKQRYTAAIKSDCFEKQKVRNREQGNIFLYINTLSQRYQKVKTHRALKIEYTKKDKKIQKVKNKR